MGKVLGNREVDHRRHVGDEMRGDVAVLKVVAGTDFEAAAAAAAAVVVAVVAHDDADDSYGFDDMKDLMGRCMNSARRVVVQAHKFLRESHKCDHYSMHDVHVEVMNTEMSAGLNRTENRQEDGTNSSHLVHVHVHVHER